jgi:DNA (cytosine-5)-methyltransferase 1
MIHEEGYTVAWHEFAFSSFGLCSKRERLFLFASRNSRFGVRRELLPAWPLPTHGPPGSGLLKYHTVADALRGIPLGATHHQPEKDWQQLEPKRETWDPNGLCRTPTCKSQGSLWHHSGKRPFTVREMARLQSFPDDYNFIGSKTQMYSQIGDAIPPGEHWEASPRPSLQLEPSKF